jgi:hypothetical protein
MVERGWGDQDSGSRDRRQNQRLGCGEPVPEGSPAT